jgi:nickel/cobalt transporter (NiCoT) family protein
MDGVYRAADRFQTRARVIALFALLAVVTALAWLALMAAARQFTILLPLGVTAFVLGLRHAVDPDHIAAIDGTTRKLLRDGQKPVSVGFYFSLGHSTIVFVLSVAVALFGAVLKTHFAGLQHVGATIGTWISALFLLAIAGANIVVLLEILRGKPDEDEAELPGGLLTKILRPALGMVKCSAQMYPVGVLFGLGFDTATEIALLGISAVSGAGGMPVTYILLLPLLFATGMSLVDTCEGIAMLGAYGWAYLQPARKVLYNLNMTLLTVTIALIVSGAEAFAAIASRPGLSFPVLGYGIMAAFGGNVALSAFFYRYSRREEERTRPS